MKTLFGTLIAMLMLGTGSAYAGGSLISTEVCRDTLYTQGGARTWRDAESICRQRSDEEFINCVTWNYQDSYQSNSFESAVSICRVRVPGANSMETCQLNLVRQAGIPFNLSGRACIEGRASSLLSCVQNLDRNLDFNPQRAAQLCEWTTDRSVYLCAERNYRKGNISNENAIQICYRQFNNDELTANGENKREIEAARQEARRRQLEEQRRQQLEQQRRQQQEAEQRRQEERRQEEQRRQQNPPPAPPPPVRTTPAAPVKPAPVVPVKPAPATPVKPSVPAEPTKPVVPATPPAKPATPSKPAQEPVKPAPTKPAEPVVVNPDKPVKQPEPTQPAQPQPTTGQCADGSNDCDGVIVDLPNL